MYTNVLVLVIKGCQLFRKCVYDGTHNKSLYLVLTAVNEFHRHIFFIIDNIIFFTYEIH